MSETSEKRSLRDRTRLAMRDEVSTIATRLFAEQGCTNTTVEQIAAEAGLSRTTFFRYFGTKEDVVLTWIADLGPQLAEAFSARPTTEPPWHSLRRSFDVLLQINADAPQKSLDFERMLEANPTMRTRRREKQHEWEKLLRPVVAARLPGEVPADQDPRPRALVASAVECWNAALDTWRTCDGAVSREVLLDRAMDTLPG
ncbi:TetR family transcriptional regulator [Kineosporia sp. NBRC 101731]|uniref:TetR/AcrR family transcriptional regulator n=1 Tax=Kineosporia sp. NBRC 101731 TaxID=3032199 RepID=UPI00249F9C53|nr:TetR family transcriptional regulator [Kineosporia sp. NBRC 101731]GLY27045.1 TetR family transcriptional regulator [Kineosporia sp. NBRC 101731]